MEASIIIVSWNGVLLLRQGLPSVVRAVEKSGEQHEIMVVDDGSTDDTCEILSKEFPTVNVVKLDKNSGFGHACNAGAKASSKPIIIMLNNDMVVEENFIEPLVKPFSEERVFAVSCQIKTADKKEVEIGRTWGRFQCGFLKLKRNDQNSSQEIRPALYASGGAVAYRKAAFLQMGGFHPIYHPFYWEDTDLSYRAWKRGWLVYYQPESVVYHKHQGTIGKAFSKSYVRSISYRNRFLFFWSNLHDVKYWLQHILWIIPSVVLPLVVGNTRYLKGLIMALGKLAEVKQKRESETMYAVISDSGVIEKAARGKS